MRSAGPPMSTGRIALAVELRGDRLGGAVDHARLAFGGALEQRVLFELPFDIGGQIQVRELQQLDGLHQLRRHHERLALAHLQSLSQCHPERRSIGPFLAYLILTALYTALRYKSLYALKYQGF